MSKLKYIIALFSLVAILGSCRDEDTLLVNPDDVPYGSYVTLDITNPVLDYSNPDSRFSGVIDVPSNNVREYRAYATRTSGGVESDPVEVFSTTTFPYNMSLSVEDLATAFGLTVADLQPGDQFDFECFSVSPSNDTADYTKIDDDAKVAPGMRQAYRYTTFIVCPFNQAEAIGTYTMTVEAWWDNVPYEVEVIAGEDENQIIIVDPYGWGAAFGGDYEMVINMTDPANGIAEVEPSLGWNSDDVGWGYGEVRQDGVGFVFTCVGVINVAVDHRISLGTFNGGPYRVIAVKN